MAASRFDFILCLFSPNMAANPKVFFDMTIGGKAAGRITMELFAGASMNH